jgi:hypothetical protein
LRVIVVSPQPALSLALSTQLPGCDALGASSVDQVLELADDGSLVLLDVGAAETDQWLSNLIGRGLDVGMVVVGEPLHRVSRPNIRYLPRPFSLGDLFEAFEAVGNPAEELDSEVDQDQAGGERSGSWAAPEESANGQDGHDETDGLGASDPASSQTSAAARSTWDRASQRLRRLVTGPHEAAPTPEPTPAGSPAAEELGVERKPGDAEPEPAQDRDTETAAAPEPEPESNAAPEPESDDGEPEQAQKRDTEPAPALEPEPEPGTAPEHAPEVAPEGETEPGPESEPEAEPAPGHGIPTSVGPQSVGPAETATRPPDTASRSGWRQRRRSAARARHAASGSAGDEDGGAPNAASFAARIREGHRAALQLEDLLNDFSVLADVAQCGKALLEEIDVRMTVGGSAVALRGVGTDLQVIATAADAQGVNDGHLTTDHPFVGAIERRGGALLLSPTDDVRGMLAGVPLSHWPVLVAATIPGDGQPDGIVLVGQPGPADPTDVDRLYAIVDDAADVLRLAAVLRRLPHPDEHLNFLHTWMRRDPP